MAFCYHASKIAEYRTKANIRGLLPSCIGALISMQQNSIRAYPDADLPVHQPARQN